MGSVQLVGKKHIGPKFKSQRILINLFSMYFTKVLQFTPLVTSAFGYRLSDLATSEVVFHKAPPSTLSGFEDFADKLAVAEISCKLNTQVTACSNLESSTAANDIYRDQYTRLFGGWGAGTASGSIEFLFDESYGIEIQFSRGLKHTQNGDQYSACKVELLLNDEVISAVPKGIVHMDANDDTPVPSARLAVRAGDVLSLRETGVCIFVLKSLKTWPFQEGYDSSKEIQYMDLKGEKTVASSAHETHTLQRATDGLLDTSFHTAEDPGTRGWFKVTIPNTVPGNSVVGFQIHNRPTNLYRLVNSDVYLVDEETGEESHCGMIGTEGFQHVVDFKFTGSCLGPSGGQSVKLVAAMNESGGQRSVLNFMEIKLMYQEV